MSVTETRGAEPVLVTPLLAAPILTALNEDLDSGFVELFGAYRRLVFSVAVRVSGQWAEAEDLTAEAFLRAYRALRGYPPDWGTSMTYLSPRSQTCWAAHRGTAKSHISRGLRRLRELSAAHPDLCEVSHDQR